MSSFINSERKRIVVGIDLGTSYSGIAIYIPGDNGVVHASSPACIPPQVKEPTVLVQTDSNPEEWLFGHTALDYYAQYCSEHQDECEQEKIKLYKFFKQDLMDSDQVEFDELIVNASNTGCMESLLTIFRITLEKLMSYSLEKINNNNLTPVTAADIMWVLTVPAKMREHSKSFLREAARQAGIIKDFNSSNLMMLLEPEAAAISLAEKDRKGMFSLGKKFIVVDCGGGTVDITSHEVTGVDPLRLKSLAKCDGGNFGSEHITKNFLNWLNDLLQKLDADAFQRIQHRKSAMYRVLEEFDKIKMSPMAINPYLSLRTLLEDSSEAFGRIVSEYNETKPPNLRVEFVSRSSNLKLSKDFVMSFIEPLLWEIERCIDSVWKDAAHNIDFIAVVGGFAANKVLREHLQMFGQERHLSVLFPDLLIHPQSVVVIGACRAGDLSKNGVSEAGIMNRIATKTIGVFFEPDDFHKLVEIGEDIPVGTVKELIAYPTDCRQTDCAWMLYQSQKKDPQSCIDETLLGKLIVEIPQVGNIREREMRTKFVFGEAEISVEIEYPKLHDISKGIIQCSKGIIQFSSL